VRGSILLIGLHIAGEEGAFDLFQRIRFVVVGFTSYVPKSLIGLGAIKISPEKRRKGGN
jgi:sugar phosphate permease